MEFALVRIFLYLAWKFPPSTTIFNPNTAKHGAEKTPCLDTFHVVIYGESSKLVPEIDDFITSLRTKFANFE